MIVLAQVYGVLQLALLGWAARSIRWRVLVAALLAGLYAASILVIAVQLAWTRAFAALTGTPRYQVTDIAGYTVDPFIEEIGKLLPVVLVYWMFTSVRRQWGHTDLLLACAAAGSGFGLAEQLLRFSADAHRATAMPGGGWALPGGILSIQTVPGPTGLITSWLPAGVGSFSILGSNAADTINIHLVWSTLAGLGLALILRASTARIRLIGIGLIALAGLDHAAHNARAGGTTAQAFAEPFTALRHLVWLYPLIAVATAIWLDRRTLARGLSTEPALRLAAEGTDTAASVTVLTRAAMVKLPWSWLAVTGFVRLRRSHLYASARDWAAASPELRDGVDRMIGSLNAAADSSGHGIWDEVDARMRATYGWSAIRARIAALAGGRGAGGGKQRFLVVLWLVLLILPIGYFVIGGQPALSGIQGLYEHQAVFWLTVAVAVASGGWTAWTVVKGIRAVPGLRRLPTADRPASAVLLLAIRVGSLVAVVLEVSLALTGTSADGHLVPSSHILAAVGDALLVGGLLLAILALMAAPPLGLVALSGGGYLLAWTGISAALAGDLAVAGAVGSVGVLLNEAVDSSGTGRAGGSGGGSSSGSPGPKGVEQHADFGSFNEARDAARQSANLGDDDTVDFVQKLGPYKGRVTGRQTPDGKRGWRIDYDERKGFHVNWWDREAGTKRIEWRYGANRIVNGTEDDYWKLLQHFPNR